MQEGRLGEMRAAAAIDGGGKGGRRRRPLVAGDVVRRGDRGKVVLTT